MAGILCPVTLENLINDFSAFIQGDDTADVTLSDGFVMPSFQKFAIGELSRSGNVWDATKTYLREDMITKNERLFTALTNNLNSDPETQINDWKEIKKESAQDGYGISGYVSFNINPFAIIASRYVTSVSKLSEEEYLITLDNAIRVGAGNKIAYGFSYEQEGIDESLIFTNDSNSQSFQYFIYGRTTLNDDNQIQIKINANYVSWNAKINIIILEG